MQDYVDLGIDSFILSGAPPLEEAYRAAERMRPRMKLDHSLARSSCGTKTGPFGGAIGKNDRPAARATAS